MDEAFAAWQKHKEEHRARFATTIHPHGHLRGYEAVESAAQQAFTSRCESAPVLVAKVRINRNPTPLTTEQLTARQKANHCENIDTARLELVQVLLKVFT
jgi:hypothetical protein